MPMNPLEAYVGGRTVTITILTSVYCSNCKLKGTSDRLVMGQGTDLLNTHHDCKVTHKLFADKDDDYACVPTDEQADKLRVSRGTSVCRYSSL